MEEQELTKGYITSAKEIIEIPIPFSSKLKPNQYLLVIHSYTKKCLKISIYTLKRPKILKLKFSLNLLTKDNYDQILRIFRTYKLIHSTGIIRKDDKYFIECYIDMNLQELKRNKFEEISSFGGVNKNLIRNMEIEEITLK